MSALIELGIGLTLVYLAGALVVTAVMEATAGLLRMRAATLRQGLAGLLRDPRIEGEVLAHPLVAALRAARAASPSAGEDRTDCRERLPVMTWVARAHEAPSYIPSRSFALALLDVVASDAGAPEAGNGADARLAAVLRWAGEKKGASQAARAIDALRIEAGDDLARLRSEIERWYDEAMDRVAGLYKRWTQWVSGLAGLAVAALVNIDTVGIAGALWQEPAIRAELARLGARLAEGEITAVKYGEVLGLLAQRGVPVGWPGGVTLTGIASAAPGWMLTAFALSLGAAFWFDVLKRLVNLRSAGPKPDSTVKAGGR